MTSSTSCPVCQRQNKTNASRCAYCGSGLRMESSGMSLHTTVNMDASVNPLQMVSSCQEYLEKLAKEDLCFILEKRQTPIILHNVSETVLGRFFDDPEGTNLDFDHYEGGALGVSRRHARIVRIDDKYVFEDLNSTNGSWLNGRRVPSGTTYPIMSGDQIWLGQFKLRICFHQNESNPSTTLFLRDTNASSQNLTPQILVSQIGSYLTAISELQQIASYYLQQTLPEIAIDKIDASSSDSYIIVHINNNPDAFHLIRKWIIPWRLEHQIEIEHTTDINEYRQAMVALASKIITDIAPNLNNESRFTIIEKAIPPIRELATSSIELSFEAL